MAELKPCPFCGGKGRLSAKDHLFGGWNGIGDSRREYLVKVICNRCKARGGVVPTGWVRGTYEQHKQSVYRKIEDKTAFEVADQKAIEAWNRRAENEELKFTRQFIHEHGLEFALASAWKGRAEDGK